jgi:hypothetical protein
MNMRLRRTHNFYHHSRLFLVLGLLSFNLLGCSGASSSSKPENADRPDTLTTTAANPNPDTSPQAQEIQDDPRKVMPIGGIGAVKDKTVCKDTGGILAHAETENYEIYICSDRNNPTVPRYYRGISKTGKGGLELEAEDYNPQQNGYYKFFNYDYAYVVQIPSPQFPQPDLVVEFPNGDRHVEKILSFHSGQQRDLNRNVADRPSTNTTDTTDQTASASAPSKAEIISYIHQRIDSLGACEYGFMPDASKELSTVDPLGNNRYMVMLLCYTGAYQGSYSFVVYTASDTEPSVKLLSLDVYEPDASGAYKPAKARAIGGLPTFDPGSQILNVYSKSRGLGDCGSWAHYQYKNNQLELIEYRAKFECDGNYIDPSEYEKIYP